MSTDALASITLINVKTLCELWGVEKDWIYDMVEVGGLPHQKLGRRTLRFRVSELEEWLASKSVVNVKIAA